MIGSNENAVVCKRTQAKIAIINFFILLLLIKEKSTISTNNLPDIINYIFVDIEDNEEYYNDCVKIIVNSGLNLEKERLLSELSKTKDMDERKKIMTQIQNIILKQKSK